MSCPTSTVTVPNAHDENARENARVMTSDSDIVGSLGAVGTAFFGSFRELREIQRRAIPPIRSGRNVLVASATASGKTEAILAPLIARTLGKVSAGVPRVRVLLIAPTRALVNDLTARIEGPLTRLGVTCGRQTSDHRDKGKAPFVLVTTPESFDSMLVRDARLQAGAVVDHLLAGVMSVFVDEAHLFDGTARGDQLSWLLGRLGRLRRLNVERATGGPELTLQLCAGSATVSDPEGLAGRLLGTEAAVVRVEGTRDVEVFGPPDAFGWFALEPSMEITTLRDRLESVPSAEFAARAERRIWQALSSNGHSMRKALVFVPTRRLCDTFSAHLSGALPQRRELEVFAHHGSLSRNRRERAERGFASARDAVLVATTTLEVGVDIGDVDLVALIGAPPDTRSLLQRIGRAGRRIGRTRVLALPRSELERAAFASMLLSARDGMLEPRGYGRRWSVFVQTDGQLRRTGKTTWPAAFRSARTGARCLAEGVGRHGRCNRGEPLEHRVPRGASRAACSRRVVGRRLRRRWQRRAREFRFVRWRHTGRRCQHGRDGRPYRATACRRPQTWRLGDSAGTCKKEGAGRSC